MVCVSALRMAMKILVEIQCHFPMGTTETRTDSYGKTISLEVDGNQLVGDVKAMLGLVEQRHKKSGQAKGILL